jgi:hypothetical protein
MCNVETDVHFAQGPYLLLFLRSVVEIIHFKLSRRLDARSQRGHSIRAEGASP